MSKKIEWTQESWHPIPEFSGYKISDKGRIYSEKSNKILKPMESASGHLYVYLYDGEGNSKKVYLHQAVLFAFVGQKKKNQECRHLNGNPHDNRLINLSWGTHKQNVMDRWKHGTMPIPHKSKFTKLSIKDIPVIRTMKNKRSSREVAKMFDTSHTTIQKIWRGERWKGY